MIAPGIHIRVASAADLPAVIVLERATPEAPHWPEAEYGAMMIAGTDTVPRCLFIAERENTLLGFAVGKVVNKGCEAELESVAVATEARRSGIGRALCAAVIDWCRAQGAEAIELEVRASSAGAISLYSGLGFAAVGSRPRYYSKPEDDALLMRLQLAACG
jgi:ribosomal-protein-alanine N-acetyltransferase